MTRALSIETISRVWRLGRTVRHSTKSFAALPVPSSKSTIRVLRMVRTNTGMSQIRKRSTVPHVGNEMRIPQQISAPGQEFALCRMSPQHPTHSIIPPSPHQDRLPHQPTCCAQSQQRLRSLPERPGKREMVTPVVVQVSKIQPRPPKNGEIKKDLLKELVR